MSRSPTSTTGTALIPCSTRVAATFLRGASGGTLTTGLLITSQVRMSSSSGGLGVIRRDEVGGVDVVAAEPTADQDEGVIGEVFGVVSAPWAGVHGSSPSTAVLLHRSWVEHRPCRWLQLRPKVLFRAGRLAHR